MLEFGGFWKHKNNQHALGVLYPRRWNVAAQVAEALKTVAYATLHMEERRERERERVHELMKNIDLPAALYVICM